MLSYKERHSQAIELYNKPCKKDLPKQKFKRGWRVKVCKDMPDSMSHFPSDFEAIVEYTYAQKYWGYDIDSYSLIMLDEEGEPYNSIAWYKKNQLTLISDDAEAGKAIIEKYKYGEK